MQHDRTLDALLLLDGESFVVDGEGARWVKFVARKVPVTPERPHGLVYSLTLHEANGSRLLGFDNAHAIQEGTGPGARTRIEYDHQHRRERVRFYKYSDAATLLEDFWNEVYRILDEGSSRS